MFNAKNHHLMKKVYLFALILVPFFISSCMSFPQKIDSFVTSVEEECDQSSYSEEYWMSKDQQFQKYIDKYQAKKSSFSSEEKREINSSIARYEFQKINSFVTFVKDNYSEYSEDDWATANERLKELAQGYKELRHFFNTREKLAINKLFISYGVVVAGTKISSAISVVRSILQELGL